MKTLSLLLLLLFMLSCNKKQESNPLASGQPFSEYMSQNPKGDQGTFNLYTKTGFPSSGTDFEQLKMTWQDANVKYKDALLKNKDDAALNSFRNEASSVMLEQAKNASNEQINLSEAGFYLDEYIWSGGRDVALISSVLPQLKGTWSDEKVSDYAYRISMLAEQEVAYFSEAIDATKKDLVNSKLSSAVEKLHKMTIVSFSKRLKNNQLVLQELRKLNLKLAVQGSPKQLFAPNTR